MVKDNKTIAKNSLFLYLRTFIITIVSLYTSRVFLKALGIEDYGIYVLVAGIISFFTITQGLLAQATQRFLNIEIGKNDTKQENKIFDISLIISLGLLLTVLLLGETVGLWYVQTKLNIPEGKETITLWTYQLSLLTAALSLIKIPYHAYIIAHERMSFYAYMAIIEAVAKLVITSSLFLFDSRLVVYSLLYFIVNSIYLLVYRLYCKKVIHMMRFSFYSYKNNPEYKELLSFSGFSMLGYGAGAVRDQGLGLIFNFFKGVTLNAACGLADQINLVYTSLFQNLQVAFMPQIVQNSTYNLNRFEMLVKYCSLASLVLMGLICIPMIASAKFILFLWLGSEIPEYTDVIVQVYMIKILIVAFSQAVYSPLVAVKKIKDAQIWYSVLCVVTTIMIWFSMKMNAHPIFAISLIVFMDFVVLLIRLYYVSIYTSLCISDLFAFVRKPLINTFVFFIPLAFYISSLGDGVFYSISIIVFLISLYIVSTFFCLNKQLRVTLRQKLLARIKRL